MWCVAQTHAMKHKALTSDGWIDVCNRLHDGANASLRNENDCRLSAVPGARRSKLDVRPTCTDGGYCTIAWGMPAVVSCSHLTKYGCLG